MKKILFTLTMIIMGIILSACDTNDASYYLYEQNEDGTLTIVGISETYSDEISIPEEINGKTVTGVGDYAFYNNQDIRKVKLPNSIVSIGECAFADSLNLNYVDTGKNCTVIGLQAFEGCTGLEKIKLSEELVKIEDLAFRGCTLLESFSAPSTLREIGVDVFDECEQLVINTNNCPAAKEYADAHNIPTGFTETNDFQLLKIIALVVLVLGVIVVLRIVVKKFKKKAA